MVVCCSLRLHQNHHLFHRIRLPKCRLEPEIAVNTVEYLTFHLVCRVIVDVFYFFERFLVKTLYFMIDAFQDGTNRTDMCALNPSARLHDKPDVYALCLADLPVLHVIQCRAAVDWQSFFTRTSSNSGRNISKSTRAANCSSGLPIADKTAMVSSSSKRFSPFGLLYIVVFFMITSFDTAKVLNYIEISPEISDYQLINLQNIP